MNKIQDIFRLYGPEYLKRYGRRMPASHRKVMDAILQCRTGYFGKHAYRCEGCGHIHSLPRSCGNRHCPGCQQHKAERWLYRQMQHRLPCSYFMLTFTVPEALRRFIRSHQRIAYSAMFEAAAGATRRLAKDRRFVGAEHTGFTGVLHTWGRMLQFHPHLHFLVPGGGLSKDRNQWKASAQGFFVRVEPLSIIYRAKFRDAIDRAGLLEQIDPSVWTQDWVVHSKAVGNGKGVLQYLSRYVFRVAISNARIISYEDGQVTFRYRKMHSRRWRKCTVDAIEFIRRFLQHVLPTGFMKIRHYGFMAANAAISIQRIRELICDLYELLQHLFDPGQPPVPPPMKCPRCGKRLRLFKTVLPLILPSG